MDIDIDGLSVWYKFTGEGPKTAVILQGWGTTAGLYDPIASDLLPEYRVLQFDFPGFGASGEPEEAWDVPCYTAFFIRFMEALGIHEASLIAHSFGGRVAIQLFSEKDLPFRIDRLVLTDSAGVLPVRTPKQRRKVRLYHFLKKVTSYPWIYDFFPDLIDDWRSRQGSEDYRRATPVMKKALVMAVNYDETPLLKAVSVPTLLIWGDEDTATPVRDAHIMEKEIPDAGLCLLKGGTHFAFLEQAGAYRAIIRSFLCSRTDRNK